MRWLWGAALMMAGCARETTPPTDSDSGTPTPTETTLLAEACPGDVTPLPFDTGAGGLQFGELAGDFTANTVDGPWTLSQHWTGCDSYVFVTYFESSGGDDLWASNVADLLPDAPNNVHFFFVSEDGGPAVREGRVQDLADRMSLGPRQRERVHFVTDRLSAIEGSVGAMVTDYLAYIPDSAVDLGDRGMARAPVPAFLGIDRKQRWDSGDSVNETVNGPASISMAAWLPHFYNFKRGLADRLAHETATERVLLDADVTDRLFVVEAELPADLSGFDTLEFDVGVTCGYRNPFACSEWDRIARIELCVDGKACTDRRELVRWITPYWRRGSRRWAIDASPLMGLLNGGTTAFRIEMGPTWERATERHARIAARLSSRGGGAATGALRAWTGGNFDDTYNDAERDIGKGVMVPYHGPVTFTPPAGASRVELMVILSGHGQAAVTNCAEWCDHRHDFTINGVALPEVRPEAGVGTSLGCAPRAADGVPPGQYGNWAPLRAYWCPGLPVAPILLDLTKHVNPGVENTLTYSANLRGTQAPGGGNIDLSAYVVWYE